MALFSHGLSQLTLVAAIVTPTFILIVVHALSGVRTLNLRWRANKERRKQRRSASNARIVFDRGGLVVAESVQRCARVDFFNQLVGHLHTLGPALPFGNPTLLKLHGSLKSAAEVAARCSEAACAYLARADVDLRMISSFEPLGALLEDLVDRKPPTGDVKGLLNQFKEELAVLHAAFGSGARLEPAHAVEEALLGQESVRRGFLARVGGGPAVPEFDSSPVPQLAKRARKAREGLRSAAGTARLTSLEPIEMVGGVHARGSGLLFRAAALRDRFGIGSVRLMLSVAVLLLSLGPARFVGHSGAALVVGLGSVVLGLEALAVCDSKSSEGMLRRTVPVVLLVLAVVASAVQGFDSTPQSNTELEQKPTFLPVPPQYDLRIPMQRLYVPLIYGIMHANLAVICLLPLPVCYYLQARLVSRWPSLRWLVPQNPVWAHRMLGYALLGGISVAAMIWLLLQGHQCLSQKASPEGGERACFAFDPGSIGNPTDRRNGVDVFVLRFHLAWPLIYSFIPLMVWDRYPSHEERPDAPRRAPGAERGGPAPASAARAPRLRALLSRGARPGPARADPDEEEGAALLPDGDGGQAPAPRITARSIFEGACTFVFRRVVDICLLVGAAAGCLLVQGDNIDKMTPAFVPLASALVFLWPLVLTVLALQTMFKFRSFLREVAGPTISSKVGIGRFDEWFGFLQRSWWEIAYFCHVSAYMLLLAAALTIRLQVFWPTLFTWALYFSDRFMIWRCAQAHSTPIVVGARSGPSSYPVNRGEGAAAEPSHVRLVLRRPPNFDFKAGQWCQLALRPCGAYCGAPGCVKPLLQWHPFSIASSEKDDFLEFHIGVHGSPELLGHSASVNLAPKSESLAYVSEKGNCVEWAFPHRVPYSGQVKKGAYQLERSGIYLNLSGEGGQSIKLLRPQLQWTGRLWNIVQWLLECRYAGRHVEDQEVSIMGPYGTLPFTVASHQNVMLIGAGVGYPSTGGMLRQVLEDNMGKEGADRKAVCFIWAATKIDQLLLCFPSLLADLSRYVSKRSLKELKSWLTVKIFISSFEAGDFLNVNPSEHIFPESGDMKSALEEVRRWLLGQDNSGGHDEDGTYICQGSLGASFPDVLRNSVFTRDKVVGRQTSLGVCFCGPAALGSWIRSDLANTILPVKVEYNAECAGD